MRAKTRTESYFFNNLGSSVSVSEYMIFRFSDGTVVFSRLFQRKFQSSSVPYFMPARYIDPLRLAGIGVPFVLKSLKRCKAAFTAAVSLCLIAEPRMRLLRYLEKGDNYKIPV